MQIVLIGDGSTGQHSADVVGAKAANLARMAALGLPVPPAFVLPVSCVPPSSRAIRRRTPPGATAWRKASRSWRARPESASATAAAAAGIGALGSGTIDAWHAGHRARRRLHLGRGARPDPVDRPTRDLPGIADDAFWRATPTSCSASTPHRLPPGCAQCGRRRRRERARTRRRGARTACCGLSASARETTVRLEDPMVQLTARRAPSIARG